MKQLLIALLFAAGLFLLAPAPSTCLTGGCMTPKPAEIAPVPPPGCAKMVQACICDKRGNCEWGWICAK